ncbi:hypothetical protein HCN44_008136 [Aphidius gifuensis]|uniref:Uncharacterized protein n=1 Tax=Aphidius gifuensis TaxID=684658 RepID=A0A835CMN5_APHGI|nr:COMM domain-containing protein 3-like [Aphidius gifuensis]KAF7989462.1 hypothetical protein HCN44_008136 [Aphidius gifuensis]
MTSSKAMSLIDLYRNTEDNVTDLLNSIGSVPPSIVDAHFRIDCRIMLNTDDKTDDIYNICLVVKNYEEIKHVIFSCSIFQLQELLNKLRDAARHLEKIA